MTDQEKHEDKDVAQVYELGYHLVPTLGEADLALRVEEIKKFIADLKGEVISEGQPERITLSYTMRKLKRGKWEQFADAYFGWIKFEGTGMLAESLKHECDHNESVLRYLLVTTTREDTFVPYAERKQDEFTNPEQSTTVIEKPKSDEPESKKNEKPDEAEIDKQIDELVA